MDLRVIAKLLLFGGLILLLASVLLLILAKSPLLGKLPGDVFIQRRGFSLYLPLASCLLLSILLTIVLRLFLKK
ncbi:MAG: hypothetical protein AMJ92_11230 [candidate division Zixibacteria bacterium SM23_81]|nr:MAG: hypothetical protein AMJ92_11230 [candidate division Zixibacteria bacterium SM23_81]